MAHWKVEFYQNWFLLLSGLGVYFLFSVENSKENTNKEDSKELLDSGSFDSYEACQEDYEEVDTRKKSNTR